MIAITDDKEEGQVTFSCNVFGYLIADMSVNIEGDSLVIQGNKP